MNRRGTLITRRGLLRRSAIAGAALALPAVWTRPARAAGREIKVGFVSPQTGPVAAFGASDDYVLGKVRAAIGEGIEVGGEICPVSIIVKDS